MPPKPTIYTFPTFPKKFYLVKFPHNKFCQPAIGLLLIKFAEAGWAGDEYYNTQKITHTYTLKIKWSKYTHLKDY